MSSYESPLLLLRNLRTFYFFVCYSVSLRWLTIFLTKVITDKAMHVAGGFFTYVLDTRFVAPTPLPSSTICPLLLFTTFPHRWELIINLPFDYSMLFGPRPRTKSFWVSHGFTPFAFKLISQFRRLALSRVQMVPTPQHRVYSQSY
jgi:hypothetical protein